MVSTQDLEMYALFWNNEARERQRSPSTGRQDLFLGSQPIWSGDNSRADYRSNPAYAPIGSRPVVMPDNKKKLPKPGPAKLSKSGQNDVDEWLKCAFNNQYLPEATMKKLCEICKEYLMEGGTLQPTLRAKNPAHS